MWLSVPKRGSVPDTVAVFNLGDQPLNVAAAWTDLGLVSGPHGARSLWDGARLPRAEGASFTVPPHGVALYRID